MVKKNAVLGMASDIAMLGGASAFGYSVWETWGFSGCLMVGGVITLIAGYFVGKRAG